MATPSSWRSAGSTAGWTTAPGSSIRSTAPRISCSSIPLFAISVALQRDGELVAGLIYNPASGDFYTAERGKRASSTTTGVLARGGPAGPRGRRGPRRHPPSRQAGAPAASGRAVRRDAGSPASAALAPRPWTSPGSRRGVSTGYCSEHTALGHGGRHRAGSRGGGFVSIRTGEKTLKTGSIVCGNEAIHCAPTMSVIAGVIGGPPLALLPLLEQGECLAP